MIGKIRSVAAISSLALVATATMSLAQSTDDLTGYHYTYYADAEKTQYQGEVQDSGCGGSGDHVYVVRANVPSAYYDATPIFTCSGGQMELPG